MPGGRAPGRPRRHWPATAVLAPLLAAALAAAPRALARVGGAAGEGAASAAGAAAYYEGAVTSKQARQGEVAHTGAGVLMWAHGRSGTQFSFPKLTHLVMEEARDTRAFALSRAEREESARVRAQKSAHRQCVRAAKAGVGAMSIEECDAELDDEGDEESDNDVGKHQARGDTAPVAHHGLYRCALDATERAYAEARLQSAQNTLDKAQNAQKTAAGGPTDHAPTKFEFMYCNGRKEGSQGPERGSTTGMRECAEKAAAEGFWFVTHIKPMHLHAAETASYHRTPREVMLSAKAAGVRVVIAQNRQNTLHRELSSCQMARGCKPLNECNDWIMDAALKAGVPADDPDICGKGVLQLGELAPLGGAGSAPPVWRWHDPSHPPQKLEKQINATLYRLAGLQQTIQAEDEIYLEGLRAAESVGLRLVPIDFAQVIAGTHTTVPESLTMRLARAYTLEGLLTPQMLDQMIQYHPEAHCAAPFHESALTMTDTQLQANVSAIAEEHGELAAQLIKRQLADTVYRWMLHGRHLTWPSNTPNPAATLPAADLIACAATTDDPTLQVGCTRASLRRAALSRSQNALGVHLVPEKLKALQQYAQADSVSDGREW